MCVFVRSIDTRYGRRTFEITREMLRLARARRFETVPWRSLLTTALQSKPGTSECGRKVFRRHGFDFIFSSDLKQWLHVVIEPHQLERFKTRGEQQRLKRQKEKAKHFIEKRLKKRSEKDKAKFTAAAAERGHIVKK